jgi:predicted transcriptional regulator
MHCTALRYSDRATARLQGLAVAKTAQITIRVTSDLKDQLQRAAKAEDRSVAYVIERILRAHFEREAFEAEAEQVGRGGKKR